MFSFIYPGIIYLASTLSRLEATTLFLMVRARDGGGLTAATNADVTIHILQTTLAPAEFERPKYTFSVYEDVPADTLVGTVKARESLSKCGILNAAPKSIPVKFPILSGHATFSISFSLYKMNVCAALGLLIVPSLLPPSSQSLIKKEQAPGDGGACL